MANVRIKDQTTDTQLQTGDYVIVDSDSEGTRKYDLGALAARVAALEAGGAGLTQEEKDLILTLFSKVIYTDGEAALSYEELEALWTIITRSVSLSLTHVSSSNTSASVEDGASYTTTLTADTNYTINEVAVEMGGVDVTSSTYESGTVTIQEVTGDIVITATAVVGVSSISAVYTQSGTVYETDNLDSLKSDIVVTATYADSSTEIIPGTDYTLSGTLEEGTSTITVMYAGETTAFTVTVTGVQALYDWDFTQSLIDSVGGVTASLTGATRDSSGIHFTGATDYASLGQVFGTNKTMIIELGTCERNASTWTDSSTSGTNGIIFWTDSNLSYGFGWNKTYQSFGFYSNAYSTDGTTATTANAWKQFQTLNNTNDLSNAVIKMTIDSNKIAHMYFNGEEIIPKKQNTSESMYIAFQYSGYCETITLGSSKSAYPAFRDMTIKKLRIYSGVI